jgi:hypothetical protein
MQAMHGWLGVGGRATMLRRSLNADGLARSLSKAGGMNQRSERGALSHWQLATGIHNFKVKTNAGQKNG